jgi:hypothetical protein
MSKLLFGQLSLKKVRNIPVMLYVSLRQCSMFISLKAGTTCTKHIKCNDNAEIAKKNLVILIDTRKMENTNVKGGPGQNDLGREKAITLQ